MYWESNDIYDKKSKDSENNINHLTRRIWWLLTHRFSREVNQVSGSYLRYGPILVQRYLIQMPEGCHVLLLMKIGDGVQVGAGSTTNERLTDSNLLDRALTIFHSGFTSSRKIATITLRGISCIFSCASGRRRRWQLTRSNVWRNGN